MCCGVWYEAFMEMMFSLARKRLGVPLFPSPRRIASHRIASHRIAAAAPRAHPRPHLPGDGQKRVLHPRLGREGPQERVRVHGHRGLLAFARGAPEEAHRRAALRAPLGPNGPGAGREALQGERPGPAGSAVCGRGGRGVPYQVGEPPEGPGSVGQGGGAVGIPRARGGPRGRKRRGPGPGRRGGRGGGRGRGGRVVGGPAGEVGEDVEPVGPGQGEEEEEEGEGPGSTWVSAHLIKFPTRNRKPARTSQRQTLNHLHLH